MSSATGNKFRVTVFGGSHEKFIGCTVEGVPAGTHIDVDGIIGFMKRRRPGFSSVSTERREEDIPEITDGIVNGIATGGVIRAIIKNCDVNSKSYSESSVYPRPSHADYPAFIKFGKIPAGGGEFSGRMTAPMCFAGGIALQLLKNHGVKVRAHIYSVKNVTDLPFDPVSSELPEIDGVFPVIDKKASCEMKKVILEAKEKGDSVGGIIECAVTGVRTGTGEAMFGSLESRLSSNLFGIPAVKGVEFGLGFASARYSGSEFNDSFFIKDGKIFTETNNNGGINGGMANGMPILFKVAIKPSPTIKLPQKTVNLETMKEETFAFSGRHDPCIVPRAVPVVEAVTAITLVDCLL